MKILFATMVELKVLLRLFCVASAEDPADQPACHRALSDYRLTNTMWQNVQWLFGDSTSHMFDLMALDSLVMTTWSGNSLPYSVSGSSRGNSGVNLFVQDLT